jgi:cell division protein FtsB
MEQPTKQRLSLLEKIQQQIETLERKNAVLIDENKQLKQLIKELRRPSKKDRPVEQ